MDGKTLRDEKPLSSSIFFFFLSAIIGSVHAEPDACKQFSASAREAIAKTVREASGPDATVDIGKIATPPGKTCSQFSAQPPNNPGKVGNLTLLLNCVAPEKWGVYVPVKTHLLGTYTVATRQIMTGQTITESDIATKSGDLADAPSDVISRPADAIGMVATQPIKQDSPVTSAKTRRPPAITGGQPVKIVYFGHGFNLSADGTAVGSAAEGASVQVKTGAGTFVSGIAGKNNTVTIK